ncbi:MAG: type II toxin-antitoxin system HicB family antitoxin [Candidatus Pacearchaeota archaeon]
MEDKNYFLDVVINKDKLSDGSGIFVVLCPSLRIASQGKSVEEAMKNIKEAAELYLEEMPEAYEELESTRNEMPTFSIIEVKRNGKTPNIVR